jgi:hypothetical protein
MLLRSITTAAVVAIACVLFPRSDADARSGGFHGGGMVAGFHISGVHFGFRHGLPHMHRDMRRDSREYRHVDRHPWGSRGGSSRFVRAGVGQWHRWSGFGSDTRSSSIADGQWHAGGEFH